MKTLLALVRVVGDVGRKPLDNDIAVNKLAYSVGENSPLLLNRPFRHTGRQCIKIR